MTQKKVIHILVGKANPNTMNGVNKVVHNLATTQLTMGYDVQVWGITNTPTEIRHQHDYVLKLFANMKNRFAVNKEMLNEIKNASADTIFHLHSVFLPELYAISRQLKKRGLKWVLAPHGGYAPESLKKNASVKRLYKFLFEDRLINESSAIHTLGEYGEADQYDTKTRALKVGIVPNGYTLNDSCKEDYPDTGPLKLCFCGRLSINHKGLDLLLNGLSIALNKGIDATLVLIGDGPDRSDLETLVKNNNLENQVTFLGQKTGTDKDQIIMANDLFVHTSRWEGIPTAVLESAGMGLPLLITLPTNMGHYVESANAGYLVKELKPESIAEAITNAAKDKKYHQLKVKGDASRKMIQNSFSWQQIATLLEENVYSKAGLAK